MTAFNVVRFRVKPGREEQFVNAHRDAEANFPGMRRVALVKTGVMLLELVLPPKAACSAPRVVWSAPRKPSTACEPPV